MLVLTHRFAHGLAYINRWQHTLKHRLQISALSTVSVQLLRLIVSNVAPALPTYPPRLPSAGLWKNAMLNAYLLLLVLYQTQVLVESRFSFCLQVHIDKFPNSPDSPKLNDDASEI